MSHVVDELEILVRRSRHGEVREDLLDGVGDALLPEVGHADLGLHLGDVKVGISFFKATKTHLPNTSARGRSGGVRAPRCRPRSGR